MHYNFKCIDAHLDIAPTMVRDFFFIFLLHNFTFKKASLHHATANLSNLANFKRNPPPHLPKKGSFFFFFFFLGGGPKSNFFFFKNFSYDPKIFLANIWGTSGFPKSLHVIPCARPKKNWLLKKKKAVQKWQFCLIFSFFELFGVVTERERKMKNSGSENKNEWKYFSSVHNSIAFSHLNKLMISR